MLTKKALSDSEFELFQKLIYDKVGIDISSKKKVMLQSRLSRLLFDMECDSYLELYQRIKKDYSGEKVVELINLITTNVTSFFRESHQWHYLHNELASIINNKNRSIRIWSAACASGEEPYTIAIFLAENLPSLELWDIKILATDISDKALKKAQRGIYRDQDIASLPKYYVKKYFHETLLPKREYHISEELKKMVLYRKFNLVHGDYSIFHHKFDMIFLKNVIIYFDKEVQNRVIANIAKSMYSGSYLFLGHSESILHNDDGLEYIDSSIYRKK